MARTADAEATKEVLAKYLDAIKFGGDRNWKPFAVGDGLSVPQFDQWRDMHAVKVPGWDADEKRAVDVELYLLPRGGFGRMWQEGSFEMAKVGTEWRVVAGSWAARKVEGRYG